MELMRLTRRGLSLLILIFVVSLSLWFIKLSNRRDKTKRSSNPTKFEGENDVKLINGTISSYESLVFLLFLEGNIEKSVFEKVRATIGVSQLA